jgi:protoporphyrinogen/coproporphyrinogen III oxidase
MRRVIIIGGGISGLSTAYYLAKQGIPSTIVERRARLGGVISTDLVEGCVLDAGPDSFISIKPWATELIRELGLGDEIIGSNDHLRVTYLLRHGRMVPLPDGLMMMVPTRILPMLSTPLLGWPTKIRMGLELLRRPQGTPVPDRSVADFIRDHYGQESVDYLAEPLLSGVYGGDPEKLSVSSVLTRFAEMEARYGSLTRGVLTERRRASHRAPSGPLFVTLKRGLGVLIDAALRAAGGHLDVLTGTAETATPAGGAWRVRVNGEWIESQHLVLACQAYEAAEVIESAAGDLAAILSEVQYTSSMTVSLGFRKPEFCQPLDGFGILVPKRERQTIMACTWVGTKFPDRVPDTHVVLRCFLGGDDVQAESDERVLKLVRADLRRMLNLDTTPAFARIARWPRSMAQYTVGHDRRVKQIETSLAALPGLHLAGNAYHGIGVPDCVRMGKQAAATIAASVREGG